MAVPRDICHPCHVTPAPAATPVDSDGLMATYDSGYRRPRRPGRLVASSHDAARARGLLVGQRAPAVSSWYRPKPPPAPSPPGRGGGQQTVGQARTRHGVDSRGSRITETRRVQIIARIATTGRRSASSGPQKRQQRTAEASKTENGIMYVCMHVVMY